MKNIIQPKNWKEPSGYSNAISTINNNTQNLYIGGQIGWNKDQIFIKKDFVGQIEQILTNIVIILESAGFTIKDLVRLNWYIIDRNHYILNKSEIGIVYRRIFGKYFPAMTMVVVNGLIEKDALVEIEGNAVKS